MDIDTFIRKYRADWDRLAALTGRGHRGLARRGGVAVEEALGLYHRASANLAEAQTRFGDAELVGHLTGVVAQARAALYGAEPVSRRDLVELFGRRYRAAVRDVFPAVRIAALLLFGTLFAVALWTALSPEARMGLVPDLSSSVAGEEISSLRQADGSLGFFLFVNNVRVALLSFVLGATLGLGTVLLVAYNGLFIGALAGGMFALGGGERFLVLVLPHGFLELFAICLAAGAGLHVGWSAIRPGDRARSAAMAGATRTGLLVMVGVVPAFAVAAFIEGIVTGVTGLPWVEVAGGLAVAAAYAWWLFRAALPT